MFTYNGSSLEYWDHPYNSTRLNERAVEVPIAFLFLSEGTADDILEVGAVMPHYLPAWETFYDHYHTVLDLHEQYPGVINADVLLWQPGRLFERILSVSTLEHLGSEEAFVEAVSRLKAWLQPRGQLLLTVPHGSACAPWVSADALHRVGLSVQRFDKADTSRHLWAQVELSLPALAYDGPSRWANTVYIARYRRG